MAECLAISYGRPRFDEAEFACIFDYVIHDFSFNKSIKQGVPKVIGLDIREAIKVLEDAGLTVNFSGSGMVTSQSLAAGSHYARGQRITLRLRNH